MLAVGFEPTRANTDGLKPSPLDHSGTLAYVKTFQKFKKLKYKKVAYILFKFNNVSPPAGLEPTTPRLTAVCSTNWAIEEYFKKLLPGFEPGLMESKSTVITTTL